MVTWQNCSNFEHTMSESQGWTKNEMTAEKVKIEDDFYKTQGLTQFQIFQLKFETQVKKISEKLVIKNIYRVDVCVLFSEQLLWVAEKINFRQGQNMQKWQTGYTTYQSKWMTLSNTIKNYYYYRSRRDSRQLHIIKDLSPSR